MENHMGSLIGIDVSRWQNTLLWNKLHSVSLAGKSISFVWVKATHGTGLDPKFKENCENSGKYYADANHRRGFYHWFTKQSPKDQAAAMAAAISSPSSTWDLPPAMDFEDPDTGGVFGKPLVALARAFGEEVEQRLGVKLVVYTGTWFWMQYCKNVDDDWFASRALWHASYPGGIPDEDKHPGVSFPWASRGKHESFWQFDGDKGLYLPAECSSNNVKVDADVNRFNGNLDDLDYFVRYSRGTPLMTPVDGTLIDWVPPEKPLLG